MIIEIPVSIGEIIDKITILEIKKEKIKDQDKLKNISLELKLLKEKIAHIDIDYENLKQINFQLWEVEDRIRQKENAQQFDSEFVNIARSVYQLNDHRADIKKQINLKYNSTLQEEKSYE